LKLYVPDIEYKERNIAAWEQNYFYNYNLLNFKDIIDYEPNILIIRLGENVTIAIEDKYGSMYENSLCNIINFYRKANTKVIVTGNFWASVPKDSIQEKVAKENGYYFIDFSDLSKDNDNFAYGKFANWGVSYHPSDLGMKKMADKIFKEVLRISFKNWVDTSKTKCNISSAPK
jgi:hypothetical protein